MLPSACGLGQHFQSQFFPIRTSQPANNVYVGIKRSITLRCHPKKILLLHTLFTVYLEICFVFQYFSLSFNSKVLEPLIDFTTTNCLWRTPWRNGSASDSRSEGCVFESRRGQPAFFAFFCFFEGNLKAVLKGAKKS